MGCFSWMFCDADPSMRKNSRRLVINHKGYLLIPKEFGGGHIEEKYYDGYGRFGGKDVYDLAADWNREYIASHPEFILPYSGIAVGKKPWYKLYADMSLSQEDIEKQIKTAEGCSPYMEYRWIGIELACYDEDNAALPFPIKIAKYKDSVYEACKPSKGDPDQGCY